MLGVKMVNLGRVPARNVSATFSPPLKGQLQKGSELHGLDSFSFLAPGESRIVTLGAGPTLLDSSNAANWPMKYRVEVRYESDLDEPGKVYCNESELDLAQWGGLNVPREGPSAELVKEIKGLRGSLDKLVRVVESRSLVKETQGLRGSLDKLVRVVESRSNLEEPSLWNRVREWLVARFDRSGERTHGSSGTG